MILFRLKVISILLLFWFTIWLTPIIGKLSKILTQHWLLFSSIIIWFILFIIFIMFLSYKLWIKVWKKRNWNFKIDEKEVIWESNKWNISISRDKIKKVNSIRFLWLYIIWDKEKIFIPEQISAYKSILNELGK